MRAAVLARCWEQVNVLAEMVATAQRNRMMPSPDTSRLAEAARLLEQLEELTGVDGCLEWGLFANAALQPPVKVDMAVRVGSHFDEPDGVIAARPGMGEEHPWASGDVALRYGDRVMLDRPAGGGPVEAADLGRDAEDGELVFEFLDAVEGGFRG
jgi:hypothetical protein